MCQLTNEGSYIILDLTNKMNLEGKKIIWLTILLKKMVLYRKI
jgi:hypothetical protein